MLFHVFKKQAATNVICTFRVFRGVGSHYLLDSEEFLGLFSCFPNKGKMLRGYH